MLRILLLVPGMHPRDGGPPRVVSGSAVALMRAGRVKVEIATMGAPEDDAATHAAWPELKVAGVPLHIFPRSAPALIGRSSGLQTFVEKECFRFDLLHVHCVWETALASVAKEFRKNSLPVLLSPHGMLDRWQMATSVFKKAVAQRFFGTGALLHSANGLLFGTREEADEAASLGLPGRVIVMPNGVDPKKLLDKNVAQEFVYSRFPEIRDWSRTVLFFSRLHPKKGLDSLVEAFGRVQPDFPAAGLLAAAIPQDAVYRDAIINKIEKLSPINIILTTDLIGREAQSVFAVADIFSLPSHQEGFSIAIVEAAGAGLPQLITDKCHMSEIADVGAGFVVPDTIDGLEWGLRQALLLDGSALTEMGRRGAKLVADQYTWDRVAAKLIDAYIEADA